MNKAELRARSQEAADSAQARASQRILCALADGAELTGLELMRGAGLEAYEFYPAVMRMESEGRIKSRWEDGPVPRRRLYRREGNTQ